eukprot:TRINITY_DN3931_c2_g1_i1.p3 TRINITY_DN3931_c2_g1~~TRINITY_DN3931_c2_g1_i1.p3  ORF type:complete len:224 (+),score=68.87 TRINITY_DN3931_c2_g1_i1:60-731(+)
MVCASSGSSWGSSAYAPACAGGARLMSGNGWGQSAYTLRGAAQRKTLVLDMDETLIHTKWEPTKDAEWVLDIGQKDGESTTIWVLKRPGLEAFLKRCCELFDVIIWTAGQQGYAEPIIRKIVDAAGVTVKSMFRDSCSPCLDGTFVKDLQALGLGTCEAVALVDNTPSVAMLQPKNYIPIVSWYGDARDSALQQLFPLLARYHAARTIYEALAPYQHPASARA